MIKKLLVIILCIGLSGCATTGRALRKDYKQSIKSIAVVSNLGNIIDGMQIAAGVINNAHYAEDFSSFEIDNKIEEKITEYIKSSSQLNAQARSDLRENFSDDLINSSLNKLKTEGIDAVLVISPDIIDLEDDPGTAQGYGLMLRSFLFFWYAKGFFVSNFTLIDTRTEKIIFSKNLSKVKKLDIKQWQNSFYAMVAAEEEKIGAFLNNIIEKDIPKFLKKYNF